MVDDRVSPSPGRGRRQFERSALTVESATISRAVKISRSVEHQSTLGARAIFRAAGKLVELGDCPSARAGFIELENVATALGIYAVAGGIGVFRKHSIEIPGAVGHQIPDGEHSGRA